MPYLIDIDGTLMNTDAPHTGAAEFIDSLKARNQHFLLMSNSILSPAKQSERLARAGIRVEAALILNPMVAINEYLARQGIARARIIGSAEEIAQIQAQPVETGHEIAILLDFEKENLGYRELQALFEDLENGLEVITASASAYYLKGGMKALDTGAFAALLEHASGKRIRNFGKPARDYFEMAGRRLGAAPSDIQVIGDDWRTDILGANAWGAKSVLIKTGKYAEGDERKGHPSRLAENLAALL